jgi:lipopolysaccharide export system permease protein
MHAAGISYIRLAKPLLLLSILVCGFMAWMTLDAVPRSFRGLRDLLTLVRTDVVSNVVREGRFTQLEKGLTFHVKERTAKGILQGIFVQDRREPDQILTYIAERGMVMEEGEAIYLMLERGSLQRQSGPKADAALVAFDRYAIDLSQFAAATNAIVYKPRERTTQDLLNPDEGEDYYQKQKGRFRSELHERFSGPLYVLAFALLGYGVLGIPQTTRQGRAVSLLSAVVLIAGIRMAGFSVSSLVIRNASAVPLMYAIPLSGILLGAYLVWQRGRHLQPLRSIPLLRGVG